MLQCHAQFIENHQYFALKMDKNIIVNLAASSTPTASNAPERGASLEWSPLNNQHSSTFGLVLYSLLIR